MTLELLARRRSVSSRNRIAPSLGQEREHRLDRVADARADRRDVIGVAPPARGFGREARRGPPRGTRRARRARAGRAPATGTAPRARRVRATRAAAPRPAASCSTLRGVLERLALEEPREQEVALLEAHSSSSSSMSSRPGQQPPRLQLDERRRDQQELGRDLEVDVLHAARPRRRTRRRCATSEISQRSTSSFRIRCSRRSNGPSKTGVVTSYGTAAGYPRESQHCGTGSGHPPKWPGERPWSTGSVRRHGAGLLGDQTHRRDASRQLPRRRPPLGRRPAAGRLRRGARATTRSSAWSTCTRMTDAVGPGRAHRGHPPRSRTLLLAGRPRPRPLAAVRAEPRARPRRAHLAAQLHRDVRRAAAHDAVQGQVRQGGRGRQESVSRRPLRLPGAHGLRHPPVRHRRGTGRRRPAPARRARARHRDPLQQPLRRRRSSSRRRRSRPSARA